MTQIFKQQKIFIKIIKEACKELNYKIKFNFNGLLIKITTPKKSFLIFKNSFGLNNNLSSKICRDKSATSKILKDNQIPNINHWIFYTTGNKINSQEESQLNKKLSIYKKLVLKPNEGSSGQDVYLIQNKKELKQISNKLTKKYRSIAISPFIDIQNEYRVIILNQKIQLIFKKEKPFIIGDGKTKLKKLILNKYQTIINTEYLKNKKIKLNKILPLNKKLLLGWKFNLKHNAHAIIINKNNKEYKQLQKLAKKTAQILNINFSSIDIIKDNKNQFKIIEVNSLVSLTHFSQQGKKEYLISKDIYKKAIQTKISTIKN